MLTLLVRLISCWLLAMDLRCFRDCAALDPWLVGTCVTAGSHVAKHVLEDAVGVWPLLRDNVSHLFTEGEEVPAVL